VNRESIFRAAALEARAYGEIGEPRISLPRWMLGGALALLVVLAGTVYAAMTVSIELARHSCADGRPAAAAVAAADGCAAREIRPVHDLLLDRSRGRS
jgi:hypothetical protein